MSAKQASLADLGWTHFFQQQLSLEEWESMTPVRVFALNRHLIQGIGEAGPCQCERPAAWLSRPAEHQPTVGDWLLVDAAGTPLRLLSRTSVFKRMASGREARVQLMAANVDTLFVLSACNHEFNPSRLERYLALAFDAGVPAVIVLTKRDLTEQASDYLDTARALHRDLEAITIDARDPGSVAQLQPWCRQGQTVALVGSSGVGKSTLVNTLCASIVQQTGDVRTGDAKGRHTTTGRSLHLLPEGGLLLDSPGLRELQLSDCEQGLTTLFDEIEAIARDCRFSNCRHQGEPGCAVATAADQGNLDPRRLQNYLKLRREQERIDETLVEKRRRDKRFGKMCRQVQAKKYRDRE